MYLDILKNLGVDNCVYMINDYINYYLNFLKEYLDKVFEIEVDIF